ncbi:MAG: hypothetical protein JRC86_11515 [Deltaproteobacteria bacterium]|nr:hypothetical protein [Deltaproteobacteria bacterium]
MPGTLVHWRWLQTGTSSFVSKRGAKLREIFDEAFAYCKWEEGDPVPDGKGGVLKFKRVPDCIVWSRRIRTYGLLVGGAWIDQPKDFMEEIDVARRAEDACIREQESREKHELIRALKLKRN